MTMLQKVSLRGNNSEGHLAGAIPRLVKRKGGDILRAVADREPNGKK